MRNFIQHGEVLTVTAPAAVSSGDVVIVGALAGVAVSDAANGDSVALAMEGCYALPKKTSAVFAAGAVVSWVVADNECDVAGSGRYPIGVATEAASNGATTVKVRLDGVSTVAAA